MGQSFSLATLSSGSAGIDVAELADLQYEKSLGTARFMKSIRAKHQHGLVVVKLVTKPYPQVDLSKYVQAIRRERDVLIDVPNAVGYQKILETATNGYLVRQYLYSSLYDRMSTRPFLEDIEKKWLAFQLLCALRDCHSRNIYHGDIKTENTLVTSWNWLYLADFSSSFKQTYLPEDNPADFSYFFDTSGRRTCYIAPERFLAAGEKDDGRGITWAMDVFSVGCVIAELFLESPIFTLSQLYKYRKGEYSPEISHFAKIQDKDIRELVSHMIQLEPESRYSAEEYLNFWRRRAFPEYFYSFLHQYMWLITDPSSGRASVLPDTNNFGEADDRIDRVYYDFDKILYFLGNENATNHHKHLPETNDSVVPLQIDISNNNQETTFVRKHSVDDGSLIFLTLVESSLRNTSRATPRLRALDLMLALSERITDEAKLDRVLPYIVALLNDRSEIVRAAAIRTVAQLVSLVGVVSPVNAYVFTEYIKPRLQQFINGPGSKAKPLARATYATSLATLAHTSSRILDSVQALRADGSIPTVDPEAEDGGITNAVYQNLFDSTRLELLEHFEVHTKALLTDNDSSVRKSFLGSVASLCVFFGSLKANDVVLSHLNTYLNDKDWILKCSFFETIVGVATFVGGTGLEDFILPLMIQALTDPEEFVVQRVISSFASMAELGLFQRSKIWEMIDVVARFLVHPNLWIIEAAAHFVTSSTRFLSSADIHCIISPLIQPYLKTPILEFTEPNVLDALKRPLSRAVMDLAMTWATKSQNSLFWKPMLQQRSVSFGSVEQAIPAFPSKDLRPNMLGKVVKNEEDQQWLSRLENLGMMQEDETKLLALREYIWRVAPKRSHDDTGAPRKVGGIRKLKELNITPQTVFFETHRRKSKIRHRADPNGRKSSSDKHEPQKIPHSIADALLDASSANDDPFAQRKKIYANARKERTNENSSAGAGTIMPAEARQKASKSTSPSSPSPLPLKISRAEDVHALDVDKKQSPQILSPNSSTDDHQSDGTLTPTDSLRRVEKPFGIRNKSSAIDLLHRKDNSKTLAETATTSANAFGQVDGPNSRIATAQNPISHLDQAGARQSQSADIHTDHTYSGSDPNVLRLLDSLVSENWPRDIFDFGPMVTPITSQQSVRKPDSQETDRPWRPESVLVATFGEHTGPINRLAPSPDHAFFLTASDDGTVKVWDTQRLERNLAHRSRQTHKHADGAKVKCVAFVENTHTFVSAATDGTINVVKVEFSWVGGTSRYGKLRLLRDYHLPNSEYAVWLDHFKLDASSVLILLTNKSRIIALDLRNMAILYSLENPVHYGTPTCFCLDSKHYWLLVGTTCGVLTLWDLRWQMCIRTWGLGGGTPIYRIQIYPFHGRGRWVCIAGGTGQTEVTIWDLEKAECREVFRVGGPKNTTKDDLKTYEPWKVDEEKPEGLLSRFAGIRPIGKECPSSGIRSLAASVDSPEDGRDAKYGFFITGGSDKQLRLWDISRYETSKTISGLDAEEDQPKYTTSHPTTSLTLHTEKAPQSNLSTPNAAGAKLPLHTAAKKARDKPPRSTVISLQQQNLLRNHLDEIMDVTVLERPVGMIVSVDRSGVIKVFQ
ncbi:MAG: hypothetical protein LQ342_000892 [Letrouitia transgressa]|nr:MAG: hypothetical protein LQ342_000892 [Letrouitia transgressa]